MKTAKLLILEKSDIREKGDFDIPKFQDIAKSLNPVLESDLVVYFNEKSETIILKNRWAYSGITITNKQYANYQRLLKKEEDEINKLNSTSKKKHFLGRIFNINI